MKDPAFLFYSKDFYEGTRTMLPKERACYIDLLIYQHQHGRIPIDDYERLSMYCSGIDEATLKATLKAKFKQEDDGWYNLKLKKTIDDRSEFAKKQSINGKIGQFWKKSKSILSKTDYNKLRELLESQSNKDIFNKIKEIEINKNTLEAMLEAMLEAKLKHLVNVNANVNVNKEEKEYENNNYFYSGEDKYHLDVIHDSKTLYEIIKNSESWRKTYSKIRDVSETKVARSQLDFYNDISLKKKTHRTLREIIEHMTNYCNLKHKT